MNATPIYHKSVDRDIDFGHLRSLILAENKARHQQKSFYFKPISFSSFYLKSSNSWPILFQLSIHLDEVEAYQLFNKLFRSKFPCSLNEIRDDFGCNVLMCNIRYRRFRLLNYFSDEILSDIDLQSQDHQGNTIIHYAVIYSEYSQRILQNLIEKFKKNDLNIDQKNHFGFTPLFLAVLCGRYNLALLLLNQSDSSIFVQETIHSKTLLDYLKIDYSLIKHQINEKSEIKMLTIPNHHQSSHLTYQLQRSISMKEKESFYSIEPTSYPNFFRTIFPRWTQNSVDLFRSSMKELFHTESSVSDLNKLIISIQQKYKSIPNIFDDRVCQDQSLILPITSHGKNSKTTVHQLLRLYDPNLRPKAAPPIVRVRHPTSHVFPILRAASIYKRSISKYL